MEANHISHSPLEIDERFFDEWFEYGVAEINAYLTKHARFAAFCDRRERSADQ